MAFLAAYAAATAAEAGYLYSITPLAVPGAGYLAGEGISGTGLVAGGSFDAGGAPQGFFFDGRLRSLPNLPGGGGGYGYSVNDAGFVVGYALDAAGRRQAVAWQNGGGVISLGTLGGSTSEARGVNSAGVVVGTSRRADAVSRPFAWTADSGMEELNVSLGGDSASATAINDAGLVVGAARTATGARHAYRFEMTSGTTIDLGTLGGANSFANGVSREGLVVGLSDAADDTYRPFLWTPDGGMQDLFSAGDLGLPFGSAYDVNSHGQVVGYGVINDDFDEQAFLWSASEGLINLNRRIRPNSGWILNGASGINDRGQIVGWGRFNGTPMGFLLTPTAIPGPSSLITAALGVASLAGCRLRTHGRKQVRS